jgi:hypothetical protein
VVKPSEVPVIGARYVGKRRKIGILVETLLKMVYLKGKEGNNGVTLR